MKSCSHCHTSSPATLEYFPHDKNGKPDFLTVVLPKVIPQVRQTVIRDANQEREIKSVRPGEEGHPGPARSKRGRVRVP